jgi:hypothetical protein
MVPIAPSKTRIRWASASIKAAVRAGRSEITESINAIRENKKTCQPQPTGLRKTRLV